MKRSQIIVISDMKNFFFSTDHCQKHELGNDFVSTTFYLPMIVTPRESLPSGIITNKEELQKVMLYDEIEILNPDPKFQA